MSGHRQWPAGDRLDLMAGEGGAPSGAANAEASLGSAKLNAHQVHKRFRGAVHGDDRRVNREITTMSGPVKTIIRTARLSDADQLNELTRRSVLHWGYDPAFLDWEPEAITVDVPFLQRSLTWVLESDLGTVGYVSLVSGDGSVSLDKLFIDPPHIRCGFGRALWGFAVERARETGADRMTLYSDPNAAPFYAAMGATFVEEIPTSWPDWRLHAFIFDLRASPDVQQEE